MERRGRDKRQFWGWFRFDRFKFSVGAFDDTPTFTAFAAAREATIALLDQLSMYSHGIQVLHVTFFFRLHTRVNSMIRNGRELANGDSPTLVACPTSR